MVQEFKDQDIDLLHRKKHGLPPNEEIGNRLGFTTISEETHRDLFAIIDFFVCSEIEAYSCQHSQLRDEYVNYV